MCHSKGSCPEWTCTRNLKGHKFSIKDIRGKTKVVWTCGEKGCRNRQVGDEEARPANEAAERTGEGRLKAERPECGCNPRKSKMEESYQKQWPHLTILKMY